MAAPKRTPRRRTFEVYQGDYAQRLDDKAIEVQNAYADEAEDRRRAAKTKKRAGQGDDPEPRSLQLAAEYDALAEEAKETAIVLELEAPSRTQVSKLRDMFPPRDDEERKEYGFHVDNFYEAVVPLSVPDWDDGEPAARLIEDEDRVEYNADWVEFAGTLSTAEWALLKQTVRDLISGVTQLPKSSLVSTLREMNDAESKSQRGGRSPRQRLTDGTSETTSTQ